MFTAYRNIKIIGLLAIVLIIGAFARHNYYDPGPFENTVTHDTVYLYSIYGNSIQDGYGQYITTYSAWQGLSTADKNKYIYGGTDSTYSYILRFDADNGSPGTYNPTYIWRPLNYHYNYDYETQLAGTKLYKYGVETVMGIDLYALHADGRKIAFSVYCSNGTTSHDTTIVNWSTTETNYSLSLFRKSYAKYLMSKDYLQYMGYYVIDMGVIWGPATADVWVSRTHWTQEAYRVEGEKLIDSMRVRRPGVPIYWYDPTVPTDTTRLRICNAIQQLAVANTNVYRFQVLRYGDPVGYRDDTHPDGALGAVIAKGLAAWMDSIEKVDNIGGR